jgi:hypothetical protein
LSSETASGEDVDDELVGDAELDTDGEGEKDDAEGDADGVEAETDAEGVADGV